MRRSLTKPTRWMIRLLAGAFVLLGFIALAPIDADPEDAPATAQHVPPPAPWLTNWSEALRNAQRDHKPVLAMFSAAWCPPCNMMKTQVLTEKSVQQALGDWVPVYLDEAKEPDLLQQYKIDAFPTFVILNPEGAEQMRFVGAQMPNDFIASLASYRKQKDRISTLESSAGNDPKLWKELGDKYSNQGNNAKALSAYQKARALDPQDQTGVAADAEFLDALGTINTDRAQATLKLTKLQQQYPKSPRAAQALYTLAVLALDRHQDAQARRLLNDYQQRYPKSKFSSRVAELLQELDQEAKAASQPPAASSAPGASTAPSGSAP